jgi:hypothetical protein
MQKSHATRMWGMALCEQAERLNKAMALGLVSEKEALSVPSPELDLPRFYNEYVKSLSEYYSSQAPVQVVQSGTSRILSLFSVSSMLPPSD